MTYSLQRLSDHWQVAVPLLILLMAAESAPVIGIISLVIVVMVTVVIVRRVRAYLHRRRT